MHRYVGLIFVFITLVSAAPVVYAQDDYSEQQIALMASDVFYNYCLKTSGYGQEKMAHEVEKNLPQFIRNSDLPIEKQNAFYAGETNFLWKLETARQDRKIWMAFKKNSQCFVHVYGADQATLISEFISHTPDTSNSIFQNVTLVSDISKSNSLEKRGSYTVSKKKGGTELYSVSLTIGFSDKGILFGLFYMKPAGSKE